MKKIDVSKLTKEIHFPIVQAQPTTKKKGFFYRIKSFFTFKRIYKVVVDYILWCEYLGKFIFIPAEFFMDNASTPKAVGFLYKSDGLLLLGAPPHDLGYRYQGLILVKNDGTLYFENMSREKIDMVLQELSSWESNLPKSSKLAKKTLSFAGWFTWKSHIKNNNVVSNDFPDLF